MVVNLTLYWLYWFPSAFWCRYICSFIGARAWLFPAFHPAGQTPYGRRECVNHSDHMWKWECLELFSDCSDIAYVHLHITLSLNLTDQLF